MQSLVTVACLTIVDAAAHAPFAFVAIMGECRQLGSICRLSRHSPSNDPVGSFALIYQRWGRIWGVTGAIVALIDANLPCGSV